MNHRVFRRILAAIPALLLQGLWLFSLAKWLAPYAPFLNLGLSLLAFLFVLYLNANRDEGAYKMLWLLVILALPVMGAFLYLCFGNRRTSRPLARRLRRASTELPPPIQDEAAQRALEQESLRVFQTMQYLSKKTGYSVQFNESAQYFPLGELAWKSMLEDLSHAEHFIFLEYFIVAEGEMWNAITNILVQKAAAGVDVRVLYDDLGSISTYSLQNGKTLRDAGIRCMPFNPLVFLKGTLNNRDHRKMMVIDGTIAYSGGINLADEYINGFAKYGHWKDIAFRITGAPASAYCRMFSEFWNAFALEKVPTDDLLELFERPFPPDGYVLSYYDSPMQTDAVSNNLYIELLSQATKRAWFYTPYLMLGDTLRDAFVRAAQRGVDVRILMPGIPDKKLVYRISHSYYGELLAAGITIYEYTPGFLHAKACLVDDDLCTIGTVNLDYRSLFLHFENNALFYRASLQRDLEKDFLETQAVSRKVSPKDLPRGFWNAVLDGILRIFAPLC